MNQLEAIFRQTQFLALGLCLAILSTGCTSVAVTRTVGLAGLTPLGSGNQVKLVEEGKPVSQPYQLVGEVTVSMTVWNARANGAKPPSKGDSYKRMKEVAASMGADGVIGVHLGMGVDPNGPIGLRSGLAVKWLAPGEARRPVIRPFVVAMLPMAEDSKVQSNPPVASSPDDKNRTATTRTTPTKPVGKSSRCQSQLLTHLVSVKGSGNLVFRRFIDLVFAAENSSFNLAI